MATAVKAPSGHALHTAAQGGNFDLVRWLLQRDGTDSNQTDSFGRTPLMATCAIRNPCVEVVRLLLDAGADPAFVEKDGVIPLHRAALHGHVNLVDMMHTRAPATLNYCTVHDETPLHVASKSGHESMVSKLLTLGAVQSVTKGGICKCPLLVAVMNGHVGVVRVLMNQGGVQAVGGEEPYKRALHCSVQICHAKVFRVLLTEGGHGRLCEWAKVCIDRMQLIHVAAGFYYPTAVSVLLEAGANETLRDEGGSTAQDAIRRGRQVWYPYMVTPGDRVAIDRMLSRGPAYRARSWVWPLDEKQDADGISDSDTNHTSAAVAADVRCSTEMSPVCAIGVDVFRPKDDNTHRIIFVTAIRRCGLS